MKRVPLPPEAAERILAYQTEKPPLGARPAWIAHKERVYELVEAIRRGMGPVKPDYDLIASWAREIYVLCKMIDRLRKAEEERIANA